jgi:hypothetical protein
LGIQWREKEKIDQKKSIERGKAPDTTGKTGTDEPAPM